MRIQQGLALLVSGLLLVGSSRADDPKPAAKGDPKPAAKTDTKPDAKPTKKAAVAAADGVDDVKGHLPPYYRYVVSAEQQSEIYKIHDKYAEETKELKAKLEALHAKEESEAHELLSPQQKEKLAKLVEDAKANKTKKPGDVATETDPGLPKPVAKLPPKLIGKTPDGTEVKKEVKKDAPEKK